MIDNDDSNDGNGNSFTNKNNLWTFFEFILTTFLSQDEKKKYR